VHGVGGHAQQVLERVEAVVRRAQEAQAVAIAGPLLGLDARHHLGAHLQHARRGGAVARRLSEQQGHGGAGDVAVFAHDGGAAARQVHGLGVQRRLGVRLLEDHGGLPAHGEALGLAAVLVGVHRREGRSVNRAS
jgi:hypothetical protein